MGDKGENTSMSTWMAFDIKDASELKPYVFNLDDPLHMTVCFNTNDDIDPKQTFKLATLMNAFWAFCGPFTGTVDGSEIWQKNTLVLPVVVPRYVKQLREDLVQSLKRQDLPVNELHSWRPHITLQHNCFNYTEKVPNFKNLNLVFDSMRMHSGVETWFTAE